MLRMVRELFANLAILFTVPLVWLIQWLFYGKHRLYGPTHRSKRR